MLAGAILILTITVCALLIAGNVIIRQHRRRERSTNDWERHCTDADCGLLKIINNHEKGIRCD